MAALLNGEVNYCPRCGNKLIREERFGGLRPVCPSCGWVYFADPKVAAAGLIEQDGKVLLVRRANDPMRGLWTLPAGFVDAGEDPVHAVERECFEETGFQVRVNKLVDVLFGLEHPRGAHILIVYQADIVSGVLHAGDDVDRVEFFSRQTLPPLAFSTTQKLLNQSEI
jgi:8-oxo-dGTP diphosphatase